MTLQAVAQLGPLFAVGETMTVHLLSLLQSRNQSSLQVFYFLHSYLNALLKTIQHISEVSA